MNDLIRAAFEEERKRDASLWKESSGYARVFELGWSACVAVVTPEARKILAMGIARCIKDGILDGSAVKVLGESLLGADEVAVERALAELEGATT